MFLSYKCITFKLKLLYCQTNDRPELIYSEYTLKACKFYKCLYSSYVFFINCHVSFNITKSFERKYFIRCYIFWNMLQIYLRCFMENTVSYLLPSLNMKSIAKLWKGSKLLLKMRKVCICISKCVFMFCTHHKHATDAHVFATSDVNNIFHSFYRPVY